jgi:TolB-like protein
MIMKKVIVSILSVIICLASTAYAQRTKAPAQKIRSVAVVNFPNSGDASLNEFSTSIPEAVSVSMTRTEDIRVIDRANLGKIVDEIALQQSGLVEGDAMKAGKLVKADILLVGSISGTPKNIVLTMKAVEVTTGKILDGKVIRGPRDKIIGLAQSSSAAMASVLSGKEIGSISVSTNPDGCEIFIDGVSVGVSPVVRYSVVSGAHSVTAVKEGYIDAETTVSVDAGGSEKWNPSLASKQKLDRMEFGIGIFYNTTFSKKLGSGYTVSPYIGQTFEHLYLGFAIGFTRIRHDQDMSTPFTSEPVTYERRYNMYSCSVHLRFIPFTGMRYFSPYAGIYGEAGKIYSMTKFEGDWEKDKIGYSQKYYSIGASFGVNMFPFAKMSLFAEGRVQYTPGDIDRGEYYMPGVLGARQVRSSSANLSGMMFGAGAKYYTD